ncbi:MAG: PAS domain S-box protein [Actinomycetota bacterium]
MADETHGRAWAPVATDLATFGRLLDDVSYPAHLTALGDDDYRLVAANRAALQVLDRAWDDVCGRPLGEVITDTDALAAIRERCDHAVSTGRPVFPRLDIDLPGGRREYETTLVPVANGDGRCTHIFGVWRDATLQRETEARSRAILEATPDVIATVRRDGALMTLDGSVLGLVNSTDDLVGSRVSDLVPPHFNQRALALVERTLESGEPQYEEFLADFDGIELLLEVRTVPMGPDLVLAIGRDVTERKRSEEALRESEARLRAAAESGDKGFSILEAVRDDSGGIVDFRFVEINSNGQRLLGRDGATVVGSLLTDALPVPGIRERIERFAEVVETGAVFEHEFRSEVPTLGRRWLHQQITRVGDGIAITTNDISKRKEHERELNQRVEVERLVSDVSRHIATVDVNDIDEAIMSILARTATFVDADAARLVRIDADGGECTHQWVAPSARDIDLPTAVPPGLYPVVLAEQPDVDYVFYSSPDDIPEEFAEAGREYAERYGMRSLVRIPMRSGERLTGFLGFIWRGDGAAAHEPIFAALRVLGDAIESALERKRAEDALRESEERFRALVQNTSDVISVMRADGTLTFVSPAVTSVLGWETEGWEGPFNPFDFIHPDDRDRVATAFAEGVATGGRGQPIEYRMRHADGSWRHVESVGNNLLDDPAVRGVVVNTRDVTDRKAADVALRDSEQRFRLLATGAPVGIFQTDAEGKCLFVNSYWCDRAGMRHEDALGDGWADTLHPDDRERVFEEWNNATGTGRIFDLDYRFRTPDGQVSWLTGHAVPLRDEAGTITGYLGTILDISERQQAEQARAAHIEAEQLVSTVSRRVLTTSDDTIDAVIEEALREAARFVGARAAGLLQYSEDGSCTVRTHEWFDADATQLGVFPKERPAAPWFAEGLRDVDHLMIDVKDLPADGGHEPGLSAAGIRTLGFLPIRSGGRVSGFVAFSWFEAVPDGVEMLLPTLRVVGDVFVAALDRTHTERERIEADEALRRNEERLRALVQNTNDVISVLDDDGQIVYTSPAVAIFGWTEEALVGTNAFDLVHPDDRERVKERFFSGLVDQRNETVEFRLRTADGTWRDVEAIGNNLLHDPAVGGVVLTTRDITDRKRAEEELRQSEQRFRALVQNTSDVISVMRADGTLVFVSPAVTRILGWKNERLDAPLHPLDFVHPDDRDRVAAAYVEGVNGRPVEYRMRHADGSWRYMESIANDLLDDPAVRGIVVTTRDITARRAEEEAEARRAQAEQLVSAISRRVLTTSPDDIDRVLEDALQQAGLFVGASAATLDLYSEDGAWVVRSHLWATRDAETVRAEYPDRYPALPEIAAALSDVDHLVVDVDDLPNGSNEPRAALATAGVRVIGMLPVRAVGRVTGFIAFTWHDAVPDVVGTVLPTLRVLADVFVAALNRTRTEVERIAADEALRRSEERFRALVQHGSDVTSVLDGEGNIIYVSPASRSVLGWSEADALGKTIFDFVHPDDADQALESFRNSLEEPGPKVPLRVRIRHGDGSWRIVESVANNLLDDPAVGGFVLNTRDVTERVEAEEALRRSEERFRALVQNSSDIVSVLDAEGVVKYTSPASRTILGLDENERAGGLGFDLVHPDDLDAIQRLFAEALERPGPTESVQVRLRHADGSYRTIEAVGTNLLHDPAVEGLVVNGRDVTERIQLEQHFGALVQNTSDMITVLDTGGRIVYASPAAETVLGWPIAEWIGREVFDLVHPEDLERVAGRFAEAVAEKGLTEPVEFRMRRADGSWCYIEGIGNSLFHDPAVRGLVVTARDMTERKRLEAQLLQAQKMEAVGQLAGGVAHDFNNLLTAITGYTALLLDATAEGDPRREDLEEIAHAGTRAAKLVDQLLSFSRRKMVQPTELDLGEVVESMRSLVDRLLPADIEVVTELSAGLDPIEADRSQIEQVLMNLVVNARDAMPDGGRILIETTDAKLDEDSVAAHVGVVPGSYTVLAISDDGVGMDAATRARVFEPFFTTKDVGQGTGLGLSTVYGIVTQAGGQVTVYSEPGRGTTFRVYMPSVEASTDERSGPTAAIAEQAGGTETVLLVEDEAAVRTLASQVLARLGYSVLEAADGMQALEVADAHDGRIDLLLTDVVLPRASGIEVAEKLTADDPHLRVLFISGYTEAAVGHESALDGHFLPKPFQPAELTRRVREILDGAPRA